MASDDAMDPSLNETSDNPSLILPYLYLGGKVVARSRENLEKLNIRYIINCTPPRSTDPRAGVPSFFQTEPGFTYKRVPVFDSKGSNLSQFFASTTQFIDQSKHHGSVLVHCVQGVSRSATIVIAYLMKSKGVSLEKALKFVRKRRPIVRPNRSFMKQLQTFEYQCASARKQKESGVRVVSGPARGPVGPAAGPPAAAPSKDKKDDKTKEPSKEIEKEKLKLTAESETTAPAGANRKRNVTESHSSDRGSKSNPETTGSSDGGDPKVKVEASDAKASDAKASASGDDANASKANADANASMADKAPAQKIARKESPSTGNKSAQ